MIVESIIRRSDETSAVDLSINSRRRRRSSSPPPPPASSPTCSSSAAAAAAVLDAYSRSAGVQPVFVGRPTPTYCPQIGFYHQQLHRGHYGTPPPPGPSAAHQPISPHFTAVERMTPFQHCGAGNDVTSMASSSSSSSSQQSPSAKPNKSFQCTLCDKRFKVSQSCRLLDGFR